MPLTKGPLSGRRHTGGSPPRYKGGFTPQRHYSVPIDFADPSTWITRQAGHRTQQVLAGLAVLLEAEPELPSILEMIGIPQRLRHTQCPVVAVPYEGPAT